MSKRCSYGVRSSKPNGLRLRLGLDPRPHAEQNLDDSSKPLVKVEDWSCYY